MTDTDTSDFIRRAGYALHDMQGRVEAGKLEMFRECIRRLEALSAERDAAQKLLNKAEDWMNRADDDRLAQKARAEAAAKETASLGFTTNQRQHIT